MVLKRKADKYNPAPDLLELHLAELGLQFVREFQFDPARKWKFDFLLKDGRTAIEIEGGISGYEKYHPEWKQGRHQRAEGMIRDMEKYNHATAAGFKVYRFSTADVLQGRAKDFLREHASRDRNTMEVR